MSMIQHEIEQLEALKAAMKLDVDIGRVKAKSSINSRLKIIDSAIDTIKTLSAKVASENMERSSQYYHGGWILTDENMPPIGKLLLLSFEGDIFIGYYYGGLWRAEGGAIIPYDIEAWMLLPKPYLEEQSDKAASD